MIEKGTLVEVYKEDRLYANGMVLNVLPSGRFEVCLFKYNIVIFEQSDFDSDIFVSLPTGGYKIYMGGV